MHGYDEKLATQLADQKEPSIPRGYVYTSIAKVTPLLLKERGKGTLGIMNENTILRAIANPSEGNQIAQEPKQVNLGVALPAASNQSRGGIRDATAYVSKGEITRTRSCNITVKGHRKYSTVRKSTRKGEILGSTLYKVVLSELDKYKQPDGKYNGISRIITPDMLKSCYSLIKSKPGNMTQGATPETLDKINDKWFDKTSKDIIEGRFKFTPARQKLIPKPNKPGEFRPLLIGNPREKIVQKALQVILNLIFEPSFSKNSFGFRPGKSLTNALETIHMRGGHMSWVINGDISKCFDRIPHEIIVKTIKEKISCVRTLTLIERGLKAGIVDEKGKLIPTKIGTPQGSILSPLLSNIVLDKLDKYVESLYEEMNIGKKRKMNPLYLHYENQRKYYKTRKPEKALEALKAMRRISNYDTSDPDYRRSLYIRYADDFVILLASEKKFAENIKTKIAIYLSQELGLELNDQKTTITNTREGFKFLGADIKRRDNRSIFNSYKGKAGNKVTRRSTLRMAVDAPIKTIVDNFVTHKFARRNHLNTVLAKGRTDMVHLTHYDIIRFFNSKINGILNAYRFAGNFSVLARAM